jgi:hypothetical protein
MENVQPFEVTLRVSILHSIADSFYPLLCHPLEPLSDADRMDFLTETIEQVAYYLQQVPTATTAKADQCLKTVWALLRLYAKGYTTATANVLGMVETLLINALDLLEP